MQMNSRSVALLALFALASICLVSAADFVKQDLGNGDSLSFLDLNDELALLNRVSTDGNEDVVLDPKILTDKKVLGGRALSTAVIQGKAVTWTWEIDNGVIKSVNVDGDLSTKVEFEDKVGRAYFNGGRYREFAFVSQFLFIRTESNFPGEEAPQAFFSHLMNEEPEALVNFYFLAIQDFLDTSSRAIVSLTAGEVPFYVTEKITNVAKLKDCLISAMMALKKLIDSPSLDSKERSELVQAMGESFKRDFFTFFKWAFRMSKYNLAQDKFHDTPEEEIATALFSGEEWTKAKEEAARILKEGQASGKESPRFRAMRGDPPKDGHVTKLLNDQLEKQFSSFEKKFMIEPIDARITELRGDSGRDMRTRFDWEMSPEEKKLLEVKKHILATKPGKMMAANLMSELKEDEWLNNLDNFAARTEKKGVQWGKDVGDWFKDLISGDKKKSEEVDKDIPAKSLEPGEKAVASQVYAAGTVQRDKKMAERAEELGLNGPSEKAEEKWKSKYKFKVKPKFDLKAKGFIKSIELKNQLILTKGKVKHDLTLDVKIPNPFLDAKDQESRMHVAWKRSDTDSKFTQGAQLTAVMSRTFSDGAHIKDVEGLVFITYNDEKGLKAGVFVKVHTGFTRDENSGVITAKPITTSFSTYLEKTWNNGKSKFRTDIITTHTTSAAVESNMQFQVKSSLYHVINDQWKVGGVASYKYAFNKDEHINLAASVLYQPTKNLDIEIQAGYMKEPQGMYNGKQWSASENLGAHFSLTYRF